MDISPSLLSALTDDPSVCIVLDEALRIRYVNPAWRAWAERDGGVEPLDPQALVGRPYLDCVVGPLRAVLNEKLSAALRFRHGPRGLLLPSECNSPTHFRLLTSHVVPIAGPEPAARPQGLLVVHSVHAVGRLSDRGQLSEESPEQWRDEAGLLQQCSGCRRARDRHGLWRMSAQLIALPLPYISHGLCPSCLEAYYPER